VFTELLGKIIVDIEIGHDEEDNDAIYFLLNDKTKLKMYHQQDCCESVSIKEIVGDINNLIGHPILEADESVKETRGDDEESETWTFYKLSTIKGNVNISWYGTSNGYYSESVNIAYEDFDMEDEILRLSKKLTEITNGDVALAIKKYIIENM
jgi:hypothetical protein